MAQMYREFESLCFSKTFQFWVSRISIKRRFFHKQRERERERESKKRKRKKKGGLFGYVTE
jgi:hypothetical protein